VLIKRTSVKRKEFNNLVSQIYLINDKKVGLGNWTYPETDKTVNG
jgi:hypothetical protein